VAKNFEKTRVPSKRWKGSRTGGPRKLADTLSRLSDPVFRRRGFAVREIVTRWSAIVGVQLAAQSCPEKLIFPGNEGGNAALHIKTNGPLALELQHLSPLIIDRVNTYYGFSAVSRLVLHQGPIPPRPKAVQQAMRTLSDGEQKALNETVSAVRNNDLRHALTALGHSIIASDQ
jgi:hypothetical protein